MNRLQHEPKRYVLAMSCHTILYNLASGVKTHLLWIDLHLQSVPFLLKNDVGLSSPKNVLFHFAHSTTCRGYGLVAI